MKGLLVVGVIIGGLIGYGLSPVIPLIGERVAITDAITLGTMYTGMDEILRPLAQKTFFYIVTGSLLGGLAGFFAGNKIKTDK